MTNGLREGSDRRVSAELNRDHAEKDEKTQEIQEAQEDQKCACEECRDREQE